MHLGKNPSPTLLSMASAALERIDNSTASLITDFPELWMEFPGKVIEYRQEHRDDFIAKFIRRYPELKTIAGGYWLFTLERLFTLRRIYSSIPSNSPFIHLESDVMSLFNQDDFDFLVSTTNRAACPRFSEERGIASIFFVPNQAELERVLVEFTGLLNGPDSPTNDMDLLGISLNRNLIAELPSRPDCSWVNNQGERLVFDGAAYGQYLFGQDPFHTNGKRISGFQNPYFPVNLQDTSWELQEDVMRQISNLHYSYEGTGYRVLNLHIHSKIPLVSPRIQEDVWSRAINEANGTIERIPDLHVPNDIHTSRISLTNRLRLAKRRGLTRSMYNALNRRIRPPSKKFWR